MCHTFNIYRQTVSSYLLVLASVYLRRFATTYTNHYTRVTTKVLLNDAGFVESEIIQVTDHKRTTSLQRYLHKALQLKKRKMTDIFVTFQHQGLVPTQDVNLWQLPKGYKCAIIPRMYLASLQRLIQLRTCIGKYSRVNS